MHGTTNPVGAAMGEASKKFVAGVHYEHLPIFSIGCSRSASRQLFTMLLSKSTFVIVYLLFGTLYGDPLRPASYQGSHCPQFNHGSFVIEEFQLYPESADWDPDRCVLYLR
jgi:hypothetical protein